jgi:DNA polymerase I-like protein with 3'-5' exonuclease and polymerase domains
VKILWFTEKNFSQAQRVLCENFCRKIKLDPAMIFFVALGNGVPEMWQKKGQTKWCCNTDPDVARKVFKFVDGYIQTIKPTMIVVSDRGTLGFLTGKLGETTVRKKKVFQFNEGYTSLDLCRGSVYRYKELPVLVIDTPASVHKQRHSGWLYINDLQKIKRWFTKSQRHEPKFVYKICKTSADLSEAEEFLSNCFMVTEDIETAHGFITCVGMTGLSHDGIVRSYGIPFYSPLEFNGCYWSDIADEIHAWTILKNINASNDIVKVFQNGMYDCAYLLRNNVPPVNYILDTMVLMHSVWCEAPKKLNFISSIFLDFCRYWKDESKGDKKDKDKAERVPSTPKNYQRYLRYNLLDCYNTMLNVVALLKLITLPQATWALINYNRSFSDYIGPAFCMSMTGMLVDKTRQLVKAEKWQQEYEKSLSELRLMVDNPTFNPGSSYEFASLVYDVLGAKPIKTRGKGKFGERSVDERVLRLVRAQHPILAIFIDKVWDTKKPLNNIAKYGAMELSKAGRFMYQLSAVGTGTERYAGKEHMFWIGTNPQSIPKKIRDIITADRGYILWEPDYSQSDAWFVAFESEDPDYIRNITDDRDTHSVHAEHFYGIPYDKIYQAHLREEEWVEHPTKGVRQNTKRIAHGANYRMAAFTLYMTIGREAAIASAKALGFADAHLWTEKQLVDLCGKLLLSYYKLYKRLPPWFEEIVVAAVKNGNRATSAYGYTHYFFGDIVEDHAIQRELSAFYGQAGTAGNIRRTLLDIYYKSNLIKQGLLLLTQTHDSILFEIPESKFPWLGKEFLTRMEQPCTIKGRTFTVPVEAKVGYSWGKSMITYHDGLSLDEIRAAEIKWQEKNYKALMQQA